MINFDLNNIDSVEFGVCIREGGEQDYSIVPVDKGVQAALTEMVRTTIDTWESCGKKTEKYSPAEEHGSLARLETQLDNDVKPLKELYEATNLPTRSNSLNDPAKIVFYFAFLRDGKNRKLLSVRRASTFKGLAKPQNALARFVDDSLKIVPDTVFKFDPDFDFLVLDQRVVILRYRAFESIACVEEILVQKAGENVDALQQSLQFVNLVAMRDYVSTHKRSARLVAAILARDDLKKTSRDLLKKACNSGGVDVKVIGGKLVPDKGHEEAFLKVLDRRRYSITLIAQRKETYDATGRRKTN